MNMDFISDKKEMLSLLFKSQDCGTAIGVNTPLLGPGTHVTCVVKVEIDDDCVICFKPYDANGKLLDNPRIPLSQIKSLIPFSSVFCNPFQKAFEERRNALDPSSESIEDHVPRTTGSGPEKSDARKKNHS